MDEDYDGAARELGIRFKLCEPHYGPPAAPERAEAHINEWCEGCPYPAHGFVCWSRDGDCLRKRVLRMNYREGESV